MLLITTSDDYNGGFVLVKERIKKIEEMKTPVKKKQQKKSIYNLKSTPTYKKQKTPKKITKLTPKIKKYKDKNGVGNPVPISKLNLNLNGKKATPKFYITGEQIEGENKLIQSSITKFTRTVRNPATRNPDDENKIYITQEHGPDFSDMGIKNKVKMLGAKYNHFNNQNSINKEDLHLGAKLNSDMSTVKTELAVRKQRSDIFQRCDQERIDLIQDSNSRNSVAKENSSFKK